MKSPKCLCSASWRLFQAAHSTIDCVAVVAATSLLACCGGGGSEFAQATRASHSSLPGDVGAIAIAADASEVERAAPMAITAASARSAEVAPQPVAPPDTAGGYYLLVLKNDSVYSDGDLLPAVRGSPYAALRAVIYERAPAPGGPRTLAVKPYCVSAIRCEFVPPRRAGIPERFVLRLADGSVARLSPSEDSIVVTATQLEFPRNTTVRLFFEPAGEPPVIREIVYSPSESAAS